jgi:hypothetical protein
MLLMLFTHMVIFYNELQQWKLLAVADVYNFVVWLVLAL